MGHQDAGGQGNLRVVRVGCVICRISENAADIRVEIQAAGFHQLHDGNRGDQLGYGCQLEVCILGYRILFDLVGIAIAVLVNDFAVLGGNDHPADCFLLFEYFVHCFIRGSDTIRQGRREQQDQCAQERRQPPEKCPGLWFLHGGIRILSGEIQRETGTKIKMYFTIII